MGVCEHSIQEWEDFRPSCSSNSDLGFRFKHPTKSRKKVAVFGWRSLRDTNVAELESAEADRVTLLVLVSCWKGMLVTDEALERYKERGPQGEWD
mmetsp:Transcript_20574/g.36142  ORF Transcript_20574/g.36142 Transcript_20574/m.36142 type:complete len:95 (-) Transcript_20574:26-310(-)